MVVLFVYGGIFKAKSDELLGYIKGFKTYNFYRLVLRKGGLYQHTYRLIVIFTRLCAAGLKVNYLK